jgi:hypothetical protein
MIRLLTEAGANDAQIAETLGRSEERLRNEKPPISEAAGVFVPCGYQGCYPTRLLR